MNRKPIVEDDVRESLRDRVKSIGIKKIADASGYRYHYLSMKMTGIAPMFQSDYDRISQACDTLKTE